MHMSRTTSNSPVSIKPPSSLVSFLRAEYQHNPPPVQAVFCQHVRNCTRPTCLLPGCLDMRRKLSHLDQCQVATCMPCSSARIALLTCRGLLPQHLIETYLEEQSKLLTEAIHLRKLPPHTEQASKVQAQKQEFAKVQYRVFCIWRDRPPATAHVVAFAGKNHVIGNWLKMDGVARIHQEWEQVRENKRVKHM